MKLNRCCLMTGSLKVSMMVGFPYKECTISIVTIFIRYKQINRKNGCATQSLTCMKDIMALCLQIGCVGFQRILLINCCFVHFVAHFFPIQICMIGFLTFFINIAICDRGKLNYLGLYSFFPPSCQQG